MSTRLSGRAMTGYAENVIPMAKPGEAIRLYVSADASAPEGATSSQLHRGLKVLAIGVVYFLCASLALLPDPTNGIAPLWPAAGIAAGAMIIRVGGSRLWLLCAIVAACFAANWMYGHDWFVAAMFAFANALETVLCALLYPRIAAGRTKLSEPLDIVRLGAAAIAASSVGAAFGVAMLGPVGFLPTRASVTWISWAVSDAVGIIALAPLFLAFPRSVSDGCSLADVLKVCGITLVAAVVTILCIAGPLAEFLGTVDTPFIALVPVTLWIGLFHRPFVAAAASSAMALIIGAGMLTQQGIFSAAYGMHDPTASAQTLIITAVLVCILLSLMMKDRHHIAQRAAYLLALEEKLRAAPDARSAIDAACEHLGRALRVASVGMRRIEDEDHTIVENEWRANDTPSLLGRYRFADYGAGFREDIAAGNTVVVNDASSDPRVNPEQCEARRATGAIATIDVPQSRHGTVRGVMFVADSKPRRWLESEITLVQDTLERSWDAAERARAEEAVRKSEALAQNRADELAAFYNSAPVGLCLLDRNLRFQRINERMAEMNGVPAAAHIGKRISEVLPGLEVATLQSLWRVLEGEALLNVELTGTTPAQPGVMRTWRENWLPFRDASGEIVGVAVSAEEITDAKAAERALRDRDARLEAALEAGGAGTFHWDMERDETIWDEALTRLFGLPAGEVRNPFERSQALMHPDDRANLIAAAEASRAGTDYDQTYRIIRPDGTVRWIHARGKTMFDASGKAISVTGACVDITDRLEADRQLLETQRRLDAVLDNASVAVFLMDEHQQCAYMNRAAELLTGYSLSETVGKRLHDVIHHTYPDGRPFPMEECPIDRVFPENANTSGEETFVHRDGTFYPVAYVASPIRDEASKTIGTIIEVRDIREEKAAIEALAASEAQFRTTAEALPGLLFVAESGGHNIYVNEGFRDFTGLTTEELLGTRWASVVHPEDTQRVWDTWSYALANRAPYEAEFRVRRYDGAWRWHTTRALPVSGENGPSARWVGCCIDFHERRMAELDLEQRMEATLADKKMLAEIVDNSDALVLAADHNLNFLAVNNAAANAFEKVYGVRPAAGLNIPQLLASKPEQSDALCAIWRRALAGEEFVTVEEFGDPALNERRAYEVRFRTLRDANGKPIGAYQFVYDVTERLSEQTELEIARAQLFEAQKLETIGQLTGGVAHDFNNLLTPIMGVLEMLERRLGGDERTGRMIAGALQSAERARSLVQRLLAFARRQHLETQAVDVSDLIAGMRDLIERSIGPTIQVKINLDPSLPAVRADPNQLELALLNLSVNARDAMPAGGSLEITARHEVLSYPNRENLDPGSYVRLCVSDTGVGMDPETLKRSIEPFFTSKSIGQGTGLGLSMVHGMMGQLGGMLNITSTPGEGTTINLWLPAGGEEGGVKEPGRYDFLPSPERRLKILLVDDEALVRESTADMLERIGYEVVQAGGAPEALEVLRGQASIDAMVTDYLMPGLTGRELAQQARKLQPKLPVLVITGYSKPDDIGPELPRLEKPFRQSELALRVAEVLEKV